MSKITYSSLKLKIKDETNKIENNTIEVLKYLPIEDKVSLLHITLQKAKEGTVFNPILLDAYFHLYIVMMYTNISFTDKQKEDPLKLYDVLKSNGIIDLVIMNMEEEEYNKLLQDLNQMVEDSYRNNNSFAGIVANTIEQLPLRADELSEIIDNFDPSKYQAVLDFAKAANGDRPI